jgi:hypothetical protein
MKFLLYQAVFFLNVFYFAFGSKNNSKIPYNNILNHRLNCFIENKGQWPEEVICRADIPGGQAWILKNGIIYDYYHMNLETEEKSSKLIKSGHLIFFEYLKSTSKISIEKKKKKKGKINYFIGNKPNSWASDVERFGEVFIHGIYNGISVRYYFQNGNLRYDFIVDKGNPNDIVIKVVGAPIMKTKKDVILKTTEGDIIHKDLKTYQFYNHKKVPVNSQWKIEKNLIKFEIGAYNINKKLIIDPLIYSTYLGTSSTTSQHYESGIKIKADNQGNAILTGITTENSFPSNTTFGPYTSLVTDKEIFISKLNSSGTALLFSTLIGGADNDEPSNILLENNQIFVCGNTESSDFPVINGNYQLTNKGGTDGFVFKLNNSGNSLLSSTYFGGSDDDFIYDIKFNSHNNSIYFCGKTQSSNFPTTSSVFQSNLKNIADGFISSLNVNLSSLIHSTFIGGLYESDNDEVITSIFPTSDGNIYFSGHTNAIDFPTTNNLSPTAFSNLNSGLMDVVFGKMNYQLQQLHLSGYIGGINNEKDPILLHLDPLNEFILFFNTNSYTLSYSCSGTTQTVNALIGTNDIYILKIDDNNFAPKKCCFHGGMSDDILKDADFDNDGNVYLSGFSQSYDYPETSQQIFNLNNPSIQSIIIAEFDQNLNVSYAEDLEIGLSDYGHSIFVNKYTKEIYLTGETNSFNGFPVTNGAYQTTKPGDADPFVIKFMLSSLPVLDIPSSNTLCINTNFSITVIPNNYYYTFIAPDNSIILSSSSNSIVIPITSNTQNGIYTVSVQTPSSVVNLTFNISVLPYPDFTNALQVNPNYTVCYGKTVNILPNTNAISPYSLLPSNINFNTNYTVTSTIPFTIFATYSNPLGYGCAYPKSYTIFPTAALNTSISQNGYTLTSLETSTYVSYQWKDCNIIDNIPGATQQSFSPIQPGSFYVKLYSPYCVDSSECKSVNPNSPYVNITSSGVTCIDKRNGFIKIDFIAPYPYQLHKTKWTPDICNKDTCLFLSGLSAGIYTIELEFKHQFNSSSDVTLTYTVNIEDSSQPCLIKPYNSVVLGSSNGYFHIDGISDFADNEVYIFSRWGNKIADIKNYNNNDKKWPEKNASVIPGTYYYIINFNKNSKPLKGWFEVIE